MRSPPNGNGVELEWWWGGSGVELCGYWAVGSGMVYIYQLGV